MKYIDPRHDRWRRVGGEDGPVAQPEPMPRRLLTIEQWHAVREHWPAGLPTGVVLPNSIDVETVAADLRGPRARLALVVLEFPKWTDGRAYSQARLLRVRHGFEGELRAAGDVLVDMVPLLQRCGFDAVQLRADQKVEAAARAHGFFAGHYQGDVHRPHPAWARDLAAELAAHDGRAEAALFAGQGI
jgi:uncharacterized protein (DUF934 family)